MPFAGKRNKAPTHIDYLPTRFICVSAAVDADSSIRCSARVQASKFEMKNVIKRERSVANDTQTIVHTTTETTTAQTVSEANVITATPTLMDMSIQPANMINSFLYN